MLTYTLPERQPSLLLYKQSCLQSTMLTNPHLLCQSNLSGAGCIRTMAKTDFQELSEIE